MSADASTPLMRQYHGIKQQVPNTLLMFRLGDFYELFYDDAVTAARELEITLTARNKEKGQPIPMCGVPYHASENYIARLIQKGYRVAICDQMEVPSAATKLVRREVTRIVTPGTAMNAQVLRSHENNYLAAVMSSNGRAGIAHVDLSTGEFRATEIDAAEIRMALETLNAREAFPVPGRVGRFPSLSQNQCRRLGLRAGLRRAQLVRSLPFARARRMRSRVPSISNGRGRRDSALSPRHPTHRARSS